MFFSKHVATVFSFTILEPAESTNISNPDLLFGLNLTLKVGI